MFHNTLILEMFDSMMSNAKVEEVRFRFEELFSYVNILLDDKKERKEGGRQGRRAKGAPKSASDLDVRSFVR